MKHTLVSAIISWTSSILHRITTSRMFLLHAKFLNHAICWSKKTFSLAIKLSFSPYCTLGSFYFMWCFTPSPIFMSFPLLHLCNLCIISSKMFGPYTYIKNVLLLRYVAPLETFPWCDILLLPLSQIYKLSYCTWNIFPLHCFTTWKILLFATRLFPSSFIAPYNVFQPTMN